MAAPDMIAAGTVLDPQWWVKAAQGSVRRFCGWHVAPSFTEVLRCDGYGGRMLTLPSKHVTELVRVVADGVDVTDRVGERWSESGTVELPRGFCWPDSPGSVRVTVTHGWPVDEVPEIAGLLATVAKRARSQPGVVQSQSVNGASVSYLVAGGAPLSVPLLEIEKAMLEPYRLTWGPQ